MYVVPDDDIAHLACAETMQRGRAGTIPKGDIQTWAQKMKAKPWQQKQGKGK